MFKVHTKSVFLIIAFNCMFFSIFCKMLCQIHQNRTLSLLGYFFQLLIVFCYILQELFALKRKNKSGTIFLLVVLILYESIIAVLTNSAYFPYAPIDILIWPMSIILFWNYSDQQNIKNVISPRIIWYYYAICIFSIPLITIHLSGAGNYGQIVFPTYFCITSLPLVLLFVENEFLKKLAVLLSVVISAASTKRGGTIALFTGLFIFYLVDAYIQGSVKKKWKKLLGTLIVFFVGFLIVSYLERNSSLLIINRFYKLSSDGGSGRDVIWKTVMDAFRMSSLHQRILGHGFQSVYYELRPGGASRFAHNSYIEFLYDFGIVGLGLLLFFVFSMLINLLRMLKRESKYAPIMSMLVIITAFLSLVSYFFEESKIIMPTAVALGVVLGLERKERKQENEV